MKKYLFIIVILVLCFLLTSFGLVVVSPLGSESIEVINNTSGSKAKLYAVIDAVENYSPEHYNDDDPILSSLAHALASNILVNYSDVEKKLANDSDSTVLHAKFIDPQKVKLTSNTEFDFSKYDEYIPQLENSAVIQINEIAHNAELFTKVHEIRVSFAQENKLMPPQAILNPEDLDKIKHECYLDAQTIYSDYINNSDISTAFFCESIKNLPLENIVEIYNSNNSENQITDDSQIQLFKDYAKHYVNNMVIENIIQMSSGSEKISGTINYKIEYGDFTIDKVCKNLLNTYYAKKQPPVEKAQVIKDFGQELLIFNYNDDSNLYSKSFEFSYTQNLNQFELHDDFYVELVNNIYEEYSKFGIVFDQYYPQIENDYFFLERPFNSTTVILDKTNDIRYRQFDINVKGATDCYIKLYSYDTVSDTLRDLVLEAYIKKGESLNTFIPEGDYIFKYATGEKWYGSVYMFSDEGQYFSWSNVLSVHEYMMTTTINLGDGSGNSSAYSQTPDTF